MEWKGCCIGLFTCAASSLSNAAKRPSGLSLRPGAGTSLPARPQPHTSRFALFAFAASVLGAEAEKQFGLISHPGVCIYCFGWRRVVEKLRSFASGCACNHCELLSQALPSFRAEGSSRIDAASVWESEFRTSVSMGATLKDLLSQVRRLFRAPWLIRQGSCFKLCALLGRRGKAYLIARVQFNIPGSWHRVWL